MELVLGRMFEEFSERKGTPLKCRSFRDIDEDGCSILLWCPRPKIRPGEWMAASAGLYDPRNKFLSSGNQSKEPCDHYWTDKLGP